MRPITVVKLGGASLQNSQTLTALSRFISSLKDFGEQVVVVLGGGPAINEALRANGIQWQFIHGQRQTTPEMMSIIDRVLSVEVNTSICEALRSFGHSVQGISGATERVLLCQQKNAELMQVGEILKVNAGPLTACFPSIPVISPIGFDREDNKFNINADWAAAQISIALDAQSLIFLTDQSGLLDNEKKLVPRIQSSGIRKMIDQGVITDGMLTKVNTMMAALAGGVRNVRVLSALDSLLVNRAEWPGTLLESEDPQLASTY